MIYKNEVIQLIITMAFYNIYELGECISRTSNFVKHIDTKVGVYNSLHRSSSWWV